MANFSITTIEFRGSSFSYKKFSEFLKYDCDDLVKHTCKVHWWGGLIGSKYACKAYFKKCTMKDIIYKDNLLTIIKLYLNLDEASSEELIKNMCDLSFLCECNYSDKEKQYCITNVQTIVNIIHKITKVSSNTRGNTSILRG